MWLPGEDIPKLIKDFKNPIGIEIGVGKGNTSKYLMECVHDLTLFAIDHFPTYVDWDGGTPASAKNKANAMIFATLNTRYKLILKSSNDAVHDFADASIDFVFIDGLHTYEQVLMDCRNYWGKVKPGGILFGHDYYRIADVHNSVNQFILEQNLTIATANQDLWYTVKSI